MKRLLPLIPLSLLIFLGSPLAAQQPVTPRPASSPRKAAPGAQHAPQVPKAPAAVPGKRIHPRAGVKGKGQRRGSATTLQPGQEPRATAKPVSPLSPAGKPKGSPVLFRELSERVTRYQLRRAKLDRLRALALEQGDQDMLKEVDQVIADNEKAYQQRMDGLRKRFGQEALTEAFNRIKRRSADDVRLKKLSKDPTGQEAGEEKSGDGQKEEKVTICHVSPANPSKHRTIQVSKAALQAHLDHGDTLGPCPKAAPPGVQPGPRAVRTPKPQQLQPGKVRGKVPQLKKRGVGGKGIPKPKGGSGN